MKVPHILWIVALATFVYLLAIPVDIMEVDSAQYASMAREMLESGNFLQVFDRGNDYLDKPPFIFWITALCYSIFGMGEFAFKFPAILFALLGILSIYRFTRIWYTERTAVLAAIILATSQGYYHFTNDVRTDVYLTNAAIAAIWLFSEQIRTNKGYYWIPAFVCVGIGMLAKGPLGIVVPALAMGTHILLKSDWKNLFRWQWFAGLAVIALVLSPMLIGLYEQFDTQPNKIVNGRNAVSGIRFFFWEQSFGRITGENVWKNDTGPFFFVHSFAWSFLPWTLGVIGAIVFLFRDLIRNTKEFFKHQPEWISWAGFIFPFIALSASHYKLPHYIYVVFPMASVIAAHFFARVELKNSPFNMRWITIPQIIVLIAAWLFAAVIFTWFFPLTNPLLCLVALIGLGIFVWALFKKFDQRLSRFLWISLASSLSINILMATWFYPTVLHYQSSSQMGTWIKTNKLSHLPIYITKVNGRALDVYAQKKVIGVESSQIDSIVIAQKEILVFTDEVGMEDLKISVNSCEILNTMSDYPATLLSLNFANPSKRESVLGKRYLIKVTE
jgi:4-amino-4-deoxy-L-arabinose transferase-like glycosyltransferase